MTNLYKEIEDLNLQIKTLQELRDKKVKEAYLQSIESKLIPIEVTSFSKEIPDCNEHDCKWKYECAYHTTAGEFRMEGGMKPDVAFRNGKWYCTKEKSSLV